MFFLFLLFFVSPSLLTGSLVVEYCQNFDEAGDSWIKERNECAVTDVQWTSDWLFNPSNRAEPDVRPISFYNQYAQRTLNQPAFLWIAGKDGSISEVSRRFILPVGAGATQIVFQLALSVGSSDYVEGYPPPTGKHPDEFLVDVRDLQTMIWTETQSFSWPGNGSTTLSVLTFSEFPRPVANQWLEFEVRLASLVSDWTGKEFYAVTSLKIASLTDAEGVSDDWFQQYQWQQQGKSSQTVEAEAACSLGLEQAILFSPPSLFPDPRSFQRSESVNPDSLYTQLGVYNYQMLPAGADVPAFVRVRWPFLRNRFVYPSGRPQIDRRSVSVMFRALILDVRNPPGDRLLFSGLDMANAMAGDALEQSRNQLFTVFVASNFTVGVRLKFDDRTRQFSAGQHLLSAKWRSFAVVYNNDVQPATLSVYVDGLPIVDQESMPGSPIALGLKNFTFNPYLYFGSQGLDEQGYARQCFCELDDVLFYSRALTPDEVGRVARGACQSLVYRDQSLVHAPFDCQSALISGLYTTNETRIRLPPLPAPADPNLPLPPTPFTFVFAFPVVQFEVSTRFPLFTVTGSHGTIAISAFQSRLRFEPSDPERLDTKRDRRSSFVHAPFDTTVEHEYRVIDYSNTGKPMLVALVFSAFEGERVDIYIDGLRTHTLQYSVGDEPEFHQHQQRDPLQHWFFRQQLADYQVVQLPPCLFPESGDSSGSPPSARPPLPPSTGRQPSPPLSPSSPTAVAAGPVSQAVNVDAALIGGVVGGSMCCLLVFLVLSIWFLKTTAASLKAADPVPLSAAGSSAHKSPRGFDGSGGHSRSRSHSRSSSRSKRASRQNVYSAVSFSGHGAAALSYDDSPLSQGAFMSQDAYESYETPLSEGAYESFNTPLDAAATGDRRVYTDLELKKNLYYMIALTHLLGECSSES